MGNEAKNFHVSANKTGQCLLCDSEEKNGTEQCGNAGPGVPKFEPCNFCFVTVENVRNEYYDIDRGCGEISAILLLIECRF